MEGVYDHIAESALPTDAETKSSTEPEGSLNQDLADAYKTIASTPWGARIGGFLGSVRKQGESVYAEVSAEAALASQDALKGFTDLRQSIVSRARSMSSGEGTEPGQGGSSTADTKAADGTQGEKTESSTESTSEAKDAAEAAQTKAEQDSILARLRTEAEKRLKDIQRAEDVADEALLKFGSNIRNFLRDAVTVAAPSDSAAADSKVLFESKDAEGRKVIHTSRFDAQLHVIHCSLDSFSRDPASPEYAKWAETFDISAKTEDIAADLTKYDELARGMEKLVPEQVAYETFWKRYYFLRMVVESEERRRREMLKGAAAFDPTETPGWEDDSDDDDAPSTPQPGASTTTLTQAKTEPKTATAETLKPAEPRKSQDQGSSAGSDASYDIVSGATSRAGGSPREETGEKKLVGETTASGKKKEESDEEDWE